MRTRLRTGPATGGPFLLISFFFSRSASSQAVHSCSSIPNDGTKCVLQRSNRRREGTLTWLTSMTWDRSLVSACLPLKRTRTYCGSEWDYLDCLWKAKLLAPIMPPDSVSRRREESSLSSYTAAGKHRVGRPFAAQWVFFCSLGDFVSSSSLLFDPLRKERRSAHTEKVTLERNLKWLMPVVVGWAVSSPV